MPVRPWQKTAAEKQAQREALIPDEWKIDTTKYANRSNLLGVPAECGMLSQKESDITSDHDAVDLLSCIRFSTYSVEEVATAFCKRAAVHPWPGSDTLGALDATFLMRVIVNAEPKYDCTLNHIDWKGLSLPDHPLRIGVVKDDVLTVPTSSIRHALLETTAKLEKAGVELVPLELKTVKDDMQLVMISCSADGMKTTVSHIEEAGEPLVPSVHKMGFAAMPSTTLDQYFEFNDARMATQARYQKMWLESGIDALIMPPAPFAAPNIDAWGSNISHTALWNLMDYPAAVVPEGKVKTEGAMSEHIGRQDLGCVPTIIQVVGMRQEDEFLMLVVEEIDRILKARS